MIEDPPLLTIKRRFERPAAELISAFSGVPVSHIIDAMGGRGALHHAIKPLSRPTISQCLVLWMPP